MWKIIATIITTILFTACGDNILADIDNSISNSTTTTTTSTTDTNTSDSNTSGTISSSNTLEVPTFAGNSQGKIVVQCESDIVYFIMAYDCLKLTIVVGANVDKGTVVIDERQHIGEVFYVKGHVERTTPITITGTVLDGNNSLPTNAAWVARCE